ncbi:MAG: hypothetical protein KatS3mg014_2437 [Actinomycetota bacterium]|nr:MAG: hypothetical protein KatS3mg014_2437 [Actinomycetota bacterium]
MRTEIDLPEEPRFSVETWAHVGPVKVLELTVIDRYGRDVLVLVGTPEQFAALAEAIARAL